MIISKRNPLVRTIEEKEFNGCVGNLIDDIRAQDLESVNGGSSLACAGFVTATITIGLWVHDRVTEVANCGAILTTSAECSRTGNPC